VVVVVVVTATVVVVVVVVVGAGVVVVVAVETAETLTLANLCVDGLPVEEKFITSPEITDTTLEIPLPPVPLVTSVVDPLLVLKSWKDSPLESRSA
jgi:hypothetical protein